MSRCVLFGSIGFVGPNLLAHLPELVMVTPSLEAANLTDIDSLRRTIQPGDCLINAADTSPAGRALCQALNVDGVTHLRRLGNLINTIDYSIAAFQAATGYVPRYSLEAAAARIVAWYRAQQEG